jgi:hypothetical protein
MKTRNLPLTTKVVTTLLLIFCGFLIVSYYQNWNIFESETPPVLEQFSQDTSTSENLNTNINN